MKLIGFLILSILLASCKPNQDDPCTKPEAGTAPVGAQVEVGEGETKPTDCPVPDPNEGEPDDGSEPDEGDPTGPLPSETEIFSSSVQFVNFTSDDEAKVLRALELIHSVVKSEAFRQRVFAHTYKGERRFVDNLGLSNEKIYQIFLEGAEKLRPEKNSMMDLELELYTNMATNTVGYTYPSTLRIWMNRKYFDSYNHSQVARNLFHEWTHKLGFDHAKSATASRPYSVPYGVGKIIEELALQVQGEELALTIH